MELINYYLSVCGLYVMLEFRTKKSHYTWYAPIVETCL